MNQALTDTLKLTKCPHCSVDTPNLSFIGSQFNTMADGASQYRTWRNYACRRCGGVVTAYSHQGHTQVEEFFPGTIQLSEELPAKVRHFLKEAIESTFTPSGSLMLCASSVDEMLKQKDYKTGSLYSRIDKAVTDGVLTSDMAQWAHKVRLDANDQRHADESAPLPAIEDAKQAIEFTKTLGDLLFVLPERVKKNIRNDEVAGTPAST